MTRIPFRTIVSLCMCFAIFSCVSVGGAKFPQPTAGFQPKKAYDKTYDEMWAKVRHALEAERIGISSSDKEGGRIVTDSVQGTTQAIGGGLLGVITSRYSYTITLEKNDQNHSRVTLICKLESMSEGLGWHDVSKDNKDLIINLEDWLYERIETSP